MTMTMTKMTTLSSFPTPSQEEDGWHNDGSQSQGRTYRPMTSK